MSVIGCAQSYYMACMQNDEQKEAVVALGESVVNTKLEVGMPGANHATRRARATRSIHCSETVSQNL